MIELKDGKNTYRLTIEYDGTNFRGWQCQPGMRTVQETVEGGLSVFFGENIKIIGAGRTDSGVHALGQVASFSCVKDVEPYRLRKALNGILPGDISIVEAEKAQPGFNARFDAVARTYRYTISTRRISIGNQFAWHCRYPLTQELLAESTSPLTGECDLRGFSKGDDEEDYSTVISNTSWKFESNFILFEIEAIRFFHHSVRGIVGSAVEAGRGKRPADIIARVLETRDRSLSGPSAPAKGLCLVKVEYGGKS
jgi:tRNA pseudouridine38-40 synthase